MPALRSELVGRGQTILVVSLPPMLVDETVGPVRDEITRRLPNSDGAALVLDCREMELINSIGITCLLQAQDDCRRRGARMALAALPAQIRTFLGRLKLDTRFPRYETVEEAVAAMDQDGQ